jgi:hypothetical protein
LWFTTKGPFFIGHWDGKTQLKQYDHGLKVMAVIVVVLGVIIVLPPHDS